MNVLAHRAMSRLRNAAVLGSILAVGGCSWALAEPASPSLDARCTTDLYTLAGADLVFAGLAAGGAVIGLSCEPEGTDGSHFAPDFSCLFPNLMGLVAIPVAASSLTGFSWVPSCRSARRAERLSMSRLAGFPDFARTAYPGTPFTVDDEERRCDLKSRVDGDEADLTGTVHKGAGSIAIHARFTQFSWGWHCDGTRSKASVIETGATFDACQLLDEACRGGLR